MERVNEWAFPKINGTPPTEELEITNILIHFCLGNSPKETIFAMGKEELGFSKKAVHFWELPWEFPKMLGITGKPQISKHLFQSPIF